MRVLAIVNDADVGGAQTLLEGLAAARGREVEMSLLVLRGRGTLSNRLEAAFDDVWYLDIGLSPRASLTAIARMRRLISTFRPDVVHSNLVQSDLLANLLTPHRTALVSTIHTAGQDPREHPLLSRLEFRLTALLSGRLSALVASDDSCLPFIQRVRYRINPVVIENGVSIPAQGRRNPARVFLSLARWHPVKGHADLFRAFAEIIDEVPAWSLRCAGSGLLPANPEVRSALEQSGLDRVPGRVELLGPVENVSDELEYAAALVLSSLSETRPLAGMEACASGVPVIATNVGACAQFVVDDALLVEAGNWRQLATAMKVFALRSGSEVDQLQRQTRQRAIEKFSIETCWSAYKLLYEQAVLRGGR